MKNQELAKKIIQLLGGNENIVSAENCMTRLRVHIRDRAKVDVDALKNTEGVMGVMSNEELYIQIVLGPGKVRDVMEACIKLGVQPVSSSAVTDDWQKNKAAVKGQQKNTAAIQKIRVIADIFTPMIPAFIASGICNGLGKVVKILMSSGTLPDAVAVVVVYNILVLIGNAFLSYLAIFTGVRAAKQFGVNEMLGGMIGAASLNAVINTISEAIGWYNSDVVNDSVLATSAGGIIGVVVGVWILAKIEHWVHAHMPSVLDISFTPLVAMLITTPIFVLIVMPVTGWLSNLISEFLSLFAYSSNPVVSILTGYILAALFLPLVLFGLHRGLVPIYALQIERMGGTTLFPAVAMAGAGQVGAALALWLKAKKVGNKRMQSVIAGALPAGILGIGEPLIYGVTLPMMKPFITAGLGAGFGGAWCMINHVMASANSPSGILGVTIMLPECMLNFVIGILISYVMAAIITWFFISDEDVAKA